MNNKLGVVALAFALTVLLHLPTAVSGALGHVVILNGNKETPPAVTCTATEKNAISNAIQQAATGRRRRQLLSKGVASSHGVANEEEEMPHGRKLTCPTGCGPYCWGSGTGCPGGMGRRNRRNAKESSSSRAADRRHVRKTREQQQQPQPQQQQQLVPQGQEERQALVVQQPDSTGGGSVGGGANGGYMTPLPMTLASCQAKIPAIHAALDTLQPSLTPPCRALVSAPLRDITCQEFTTDCGVQQVKLVNADENSILSSNVVSSSTTTSVTSTAFCQSVGVSFEAAAKFSVGLVRFVVSSSTAGSSSTESDVVVVYNRTATEAPFYFNGETALGEPKGVNFPLGTYTMTITSDYSPLSGGQSFPFTVNNC
jgi:hypothetical protein